MNTRFDNVADAAAQLAGEPSVAAQVNSEINWNCLVGALLNMRVAKGLTQEQVAEAMGCDPSKVSRLESGNDRQLKWPDIVMYARALRVDVSMMFDDSGLPAAERIKRCVFRIDEDLDRLAALAKELGGNDDITKEINRFYKQVLFNFLMRFQKNSEKLSDVIRISGQPQRACLPEKTSERSVSLERTEPAPLKG